MPAWDRARWSHRCAERGDLNVKLKRDDATAALIADMIDSQGDGAAFTA